MQLEFEVELIEAEEVMQLQTSRVRNLRKRIEVLIISTIRRIIEKSLNSGTKISTNSKLEKSAKIKSHQMQILGMNTGGNKSKSF